MFLTPGENALNWSCPLFSVLEVLQGGHLLSERRGQTSEPWGIKELD